ncbi:hypothetical protein [Mucilaginibacter sp. HD30]
MEKLVISVPDKKSALVKQILKGLGVTIQPQNEVIPPSYREKILKIPTWTEDDLRVFEQANDAFESLKPQQW